MQTFGQGTNFGLAMVDVEKVENYKPVEVPVEINDTVQFLTDESKQTVGGEGAIFVKDPLQKKPGAAYSFNELCEVEQRMLEDNSYAFDKKILYQ